MDFSRVQLFWLNFGGGVELKLNLKSLKKYKLLTIIRKFYLRNIDDI